MSRQTKRKKEIKPLSTTKVTLYRARARRVGVGASDARIPELRVLRDANVVLFGLGCLGAPCAMEFARAGVGHLAVIDHDEVDPATTVRWPRGLPVAGLAKAEVIADWIKTEYPSCCVKPFVHRLGGIRRDFDLNPSGESDVSLLNNVMKDATLVFDATAELGIQHLLTDLCQKVQIPYVGLSGTYGAWGGKVFRFRPGGHRGCWICYRLLCDENSHLEPPSDERGEVQPKGCADPTFTGANFDMMVIAMTGVRMAISTLCEGAAEGYPQTGFDVLHISLRDSGGRLILPEFQEIEVPIHPRCGNCH